LGFGGQELASPASARSDINIFDVFQTKGLFEQLASKAKTDERTDKTLEKFESEPDEQLSDAARRHCAARGHPIRRNSPEAPHPDENAQTYHCGTTAEQRARRPQ